MSNPKEVLGSTKACEIMLSMYSEARKKHDCFLKKCKDADGQWLPEWEDCFTFDHWGENLIVVVFYYHIGEDKSTKAIMREVSYGEIK